MRSMVPGTWARSSTRSVVSTWPGRSSVTGTLRRSGAATGTDIRVEAAGLSRAKNQINTFENFASQIARFYGSPRLAQLVDWPDSESTPSASEKPFTS
jgi:hypothetical protein